MAVYSVYCKLDLELLGHPEHVLMPLVRSFLCGQPEKPSAYKLPTDVDCARSDSSFSYMFKHFMPEQECPGSKRS